MDFSDNEELAQFRSGLRSWLREHVIEREEDESPALFLKRWHQVLFQGGWVGLSWPEEYGGRGLSNAYDVVLNEEIGASGAPDAPRIGYMGRAFLQWGTEEQRKRFLPRLLSGEDYWCQGFSEPGAGSDLANLSTRAVKDGSSYRISGQKVWTSFAEYADYAILLARTGEPGGRHKGVSAFVVSMDSPGIEVRPIIAATGESEFCEMFFDGVEVAEENRIGVEGDGWPIAMMTVAYERGAADVGYLSKFGAALRELRGLLGDRVHQDASTRRRVADLEVRYRILSQHVRRRLTERDSGDVLPGPEMSVDKLLMTDVDQALHRTAVDLLGASVLLEPGDAPWLQRYVYARAASIYGGAEQIQLNIIAQRVLGMPR
ncbi:acyl-CoA dehydrogenase [Nocardioides mangrovicus]|uniref:Acyl-CoA dehydrogenase n=1 Tax=Nocardioides mangrovicus TaxID=2478913 RepID=A0A3L8NWY1_9ACTN|nr:acyl-CoA dehydrogenase family protein [Nocardioides mangrovicus]RLV47434.1 acyl-CoA dehydrogenase [Nocardioides mangrovicus]